MLLGMSLLVVLDESPGSDRSESMVMGLSVLLSRSEVTGPASKAPTLPLPRGSVLPPADSS